jgi:beta-phosphoglucomutase-like phosphatase (HAD superfamily)
LEDCVLVDVDDTLVDTDRRRWTAWRMVLDREIEFQIVGKWSSRRILKDLAHGDKRVWRQFWRILLCWDKRGVKIIQLDEPIPFAREVLEKWARSFRIVYLTGRTSNMCDITLKELGKFGFPILNTDLVMSPDLESYLNSPEKSRRDLVTKVMNKLNVIVAVDDNPFWMTLYKQLNISQRIGLLRSERYPRDAYRDATRIIDGWKELHDDKIFIS